MFRMLKISPLRQQHTKPVAAKPETAGLSGIFAPMHRALQVAAQKVFLPLAATFLLTACLSAPQRSLPSAYDFGTPAQRIVTTGAWGDMALEVRAPVWLEAPGIVYRLAYEDPLRWRNYADSRWADSPARLLGGQLRQQLGLVALDGAAAAGCLLRVELQSFTQVFVTPQQSHGLLQASVVLIDGRRKILAEQAFAVEKQAATPDARGGVQALVTAGKILGLQLAGWLETEPSIQRCKRSPMR